MDNLVPFQWSIKLDDGQIYVVQAQTDSELEERINEVKVRFLKNQWKEEDSFVPEDPFPQEPAQPQVGLVCKVCGAKADIVEGISKKGNPYKIFKCSKFPETQKDGGHSYFMFVK